MKLSTRLKKELSIPVFGLKNGSEWFQDFELKHYEVVFFLDCQLFARRVLLDSADRVHKDLKSHGCTLLLQESPVINDNHEIILHYTRTNYREWCKL